MSYDLGGFSVTASTSRVMLIIFAVYSVVIVGFGFYIKYQSKKGGKDGLASFLTGGGGLGAFAIAMIAATNSMAGGTMVAAPGCIGLLRRFPDCCLWPGQRGAQSGDPA